MCSDSILNMDFHKFIEYIPNNVKNARKKETSIVFHITNPTHKILP